MITDVKQLAIIGPTASGKSDLAIKIAKKIDAYILSIDSLSIYKEIDIVSAKPSMQERKEITHFGIDVLYPNEYFSAEIFINLYKNTLQKCQEDSKSLLIVGGTSFYLKSLLDGLSELPKIDAATKEKVALRLRDPQEAHSFLMSLDWAYMQNISPHDRYRIEKALLIYESSGLPPSVWFCEHPAEPIIKELDIFNIDVHREILKERIIKRTRKMLEMGLIDEVCRLEQRYTRAPNAMGAIGIVETLAYLDGKVSQQKMGELISTHTAQLAKRQQTFNKTQFKSVISAPLDELESIILERVAL